MSDKKNIPKKPYAGKNKKFGINQRNRFQTRERESFLNLAKVHIINQGKWINEMDIEKGGITMNITLASSLALPARKYLCFFVSTAGEKSELGIIIIS